MLKALFEHWSESHTYKEKERMAEMGNNNGCYYTIMAAMGNNNGC